MGITTGGVFGNVRNKIGDITFKVLKGQNVLARKATPSNPKTKDQTDQRTKMANIVARWQNLTKNSISQFYTNPNRYLSEYNQFVKDNIMYVAEDGSMENANFKITKGKLSPVTLLDIEFEGILPQLSVTYSTDLGTNGATTDCIGLALINGAGLVIAKTIESVDKRGNGATNFNTNQTFDNGFDGFLYIWAYQTTAPNFGLCTNSSAKALVIPPQ